jgi:hypothetical protein
MPTRRNVAAALLALPWAGAAALAQPVLPSPVLAEARGELDAFRSELKRAAEARDIARLRILIADGFTHTRASGRTDDKDARIIALLAREPGIENGLLVDAEVRLHGPDTAILTARSPILNRDENRTYDFRWMQVFTRISGRWQLAASQESRLEPER